MKRSGRGGPWTDIPSARVRFACEAGFLVLVAALCALAELRPRAIILVMAVAWLLVAIIERSSSTQPRVEVRDTPLYDDEAVESPASARDAQEAYRWLFWRRSRARVEEEPVSPTASIEEHPAPTHVRRIETPAEPEPPGPEAEPAPEPVPAPGAAATSRPFDLAGLADTAVEPPRRARRLLQPRHADPPPPPAPAPEPPPPEPREWNLWDLERRAREQAGEGARDEEWSALFTHLRTFANADGFLPKEFDALVRESFGELIEAT